MNMRPHITKRLALRLAAIFGAFHFIILGLSIIDADWRGGEGLGYGLALSDGPLLALCQHYRAVGTLLCYGTYRGNYVDLLVTGTLMYAMVGFIMGAAIDWIRALIARH